MLKQVNTMLQVGIISRTNLKWVSLLHVAKNQTGLISLVVTIEI